MYTIVKHIVTVASFLVQLKIYGKSISEVESICVAHVESSTSYLFNMGYYFLVYFDGYFVIDQSKRKADIQRRS